MERFGEWEARWTSLWAALGLGAGDAGSLRALLARWDDPARRYHDRRHLGECLVRFDAARDRARHAAEVEAALWYHDAVYDTHRTDNEERSAVLAADALTRAGADAAVVARVRALVLATRHDAAPPTPDAALVVDVDLGILAAPPRRFDEYESQVREEYAWVPDAVFRRTRRGILEGFLARDRIYTSGAFDADEPRARANLARSIARLS